MLYAKLQKRWRREKEPRQRKRINKLVQAALGKSHLEPTGKTV